jgi:DNA phosphorothioation-dependent restriction protein DptH
VRLKVEEVAPLVIRGPVCQAVIGDSELDCSHLGILGQLQDGNRRLGISLSKPQCVVLLGYMGSGKSYALGVLIENALLPLSALVRSTRPLSVVAFNYRRNPEARFEYCGFAQPNHRESEVETLRERYGGLPCAVDAVNVFGYGPELKRRQEEYQGLPTYPIQFRPEELGAEHWSILMKPPSSQAEYMNVVRDIIQELYYNDRLTCKNLERSIQMDERLTESQRKKAMSRLTFAKRWLADERPYEWSDLLREGSLNIFDLRVQTLGSDEALKLCLVITDLVRRTRNGVNKMIVFDEAHEYVDCKELIGELENAITQIRHDGLSFVLASQFPERIPETIFKYLVTRFVFKLPTAKAVNYLRKVVSNLKVLSLDQVANLGLEQGKCFIQTDHDCTDDALHVPQVLDIRPRCSLHGGATVKQI